MLGTIALNVTEGRTHLWGKVRAAFQYVYEHHRNDADFFIKLDDDSYPILENLRMMLQPYSPSDPIYFGCRFILPVDQRLGQVSEAYQMNRMLLFVYFCYKGIHVGRIWIRS